MAVHALAHAAFADRRDEARDIILPDEIVQVVVGLQDDAAAASAIAAARAALGDVSLAMERDTAFAAVPRLRVNFYFVNEHDVVAPTKKARPKPRLEIGWRKLILRGGGFRHNDIHAAAVLVELHLAVGEREQRPVAAGADIFARDKFAAALADDDAARADDLPAKFFYAQPFADAVATVANATLTFFMCHKPEKLTVNSLDFDDRQFLTMSDGFVITLAAFHLEREFLLAADVFDHVGLDASRRSRWACPRRACRRD